MRGSSTWLRRLCVGAIAGLGLALLPASASAGAVTVITGATTEKSGLQAQYKIEVPSNWNGTLLLWSHGYNSFTVPVLPPDDAKDAATGAYLLSQGYALAGSAYARAGWSVDQALQDQIALLDEFDKKVGHPARTIAWGESLGGMITAGLVQQFPNRFAGALSMCGVLAGGPGVWNQGLDSEFALATLQAPFKMVNFTSPSDVFANYLAATAVVTAAQTTKEGRARIALSAALADVPGWVDPASPEPAATDYAAQEVNQLAWDTNIDFLFAFFGRAELESPTRAGGNFSWNTGVDYRVQLAHSVDRAEVEALYKTAGLDLNKELDTLNAASRIAADPKAVAYVSKFITYNGDLDIPVLTMHTTGDGLVEVTDENAYASVVRSAGDSSLLRQVYVHRAGHCTFTPAETVTGIKTLIKRIESKHWGSINPSTMNSQATSLGSTLNAAPASFIHFQPAQFLRPFDARNVGDEGQSGNQD
jgi:pimeloyl-ACP methyl ester carboxylesterase